MNRSVLIVLALIALWAVASAADAPAAADPASEATIAKSKGSKKHHDDHDYNSYHDSKKHHGGKHSDSYDDDSSKNSYKSPPSGDGYDEYESSPSKDDYYDDSNKKHKSKDKHRHESRDEYKYDKYDNSPRDYDSYDSYGDYYDGSIPKHAWHDGEGNCNRPWDHVEHNKGHCLSARSYVTVTGKDGGVSQPLNYDAGCPPVAPGNPAGTTRTPCSVPTFCGDANTLLPGCNCITSTASGTSRSDYVAYTASNVQQHMRAQPGLPMVDVRKHSWSCVDARGEQPMLGTAGGDLAEAASVAMAILYLLNKPFDASVAGTVFSIFANNVANPERPLYLHTDDTKLRQMFIDLRNRPGAPDTNFPSAFPEMAPQDPTELAVWLDYLSRHDYNGCGHVRQMITDAFKVYYSQALGRPLATDCTGVSASNCVDSQAVMKYFIQQFFKFWWTTPSGSRERRNVAFITEDILIGPLQGKAVAIIKNQGASGGCKHEAPLVRPDFASSQMFIYHGDAVVLWREYVVTTYLAKFIAEQGLTTAAVLDAWNKVAGMQLGATLAYLNPANKIGQWLVNVPVKRNEPGKYDDYYKNQA